MSEPLPVDHEEGASGSPAAERRRPIASFFRRLLKEQPLGGLAAPRDSSAAGSTSTLNASSMRGCRSRDCCCY